MVAIILGTVVDLITSKGFVVKNKSMILRFLVALFTSCSNLQSLIVNHLFTDWLFFGEPGFHMNMN